MKNKGLVITALILLAVVIILLVMFLFASISGKANFNKGILNIGKHSETVIFDKTYDLENIQNIDIKQDAGDIIFKEGADNKIQIVLYGDNKENAKVNENEGRLEIDYKMKRKIAFFSFGLSFGDTKNDIIIYLPSNYDGNIKIDSDYGNVEMIDLENAKLNIKCDAGNIEIGKIKNITANCDYGNIEIGAVLNKCDIKADYGNVEIDTIEIKEDSSIKADMGNITINKANDIYIDADVDLGDVKIASNNRNADVILEIKCDLGNIEVR